jgi:Ca2+-binding EF-hand superfamily protein
MTVISSGASSASSWGTAPPRMDRHGAGKPSFASIDSDGSGGLSQSELQSMLDKGPGGAQGSTGTSSNVSSTSTSTSTASGTSNTSTALSELFSKLDTDGDGSISQSELDTGMKPPGHGAQSQNAYASMGMDTQGFAAMMGGGMQGVGGMPPPPPPDDAGSITSAITSVLGSLDADTNSSISLSEFGLSGNAGASGATTSAATTTSGNTASTDSTRQALFDMIDSDQSGELSSTEVSAFAEQMKALFEKMQQMGAPMSTNVGAPFGAQAGDASLSFSRLSVTA